MTHTINPYSIVAGCEATGGHRTLEAVNPATGTAIPPAFIEATDEEIDAAVQSAEHAVTDLRTSSNEQVASFLECIAEHILDLGDALIERGHAETALPAARLQAERGRTIGQLQLFAALRRKGTYVDARIDHADPQRTPLPKPDVRYMLTPIGPVVVFGASNFPLAFSVAGGDTAAALAAGCPVVFKAHHAHMGTAALVGTAVTAAAKATGMPQGIFSLLHGRGRTVGDALVRHPNTCAVTFTGSRAGGRALFDIAAARPDPIPVFAEMGSVNPIFVLPGAMADRTEAIATGFAQSVALGVGQFCTNPGLLFTLDGPVAQSFIAATERNLGEVGPATMLTPGICSAYREGIERLASIPSVTSSHAACVDHDGRVLPTLFRTDGDTFLGDPRLAEEIFGPTTLIVTCKSVAQMETIAQGLDGQLTATVHATETELDDASTLLALLERKAGRVLFNGFPTGVEVCHAMHHGGPYPATTDARFTSVGSASIQRFLRPVAYQGFPDTALPASLREENVLGIQRTVDGQCSND